MKKVIALFILVAGLSTGFAQNAAKLSSGDDQLDKSIASITRVARKDASTFKATLVAKYSITEDQAQNYYGKYAGGDVYMAFETAKESGVTTDEVLVMYQKNRKASKGWEDTLKELGVKQNSKSFESIKSAVVNNGID